MADDHPTEVKIPAALLAAGVVLLLISAFVTKGDASVGGVMLLVTLGVAIQVVLGVVALFITAALLSLDFGYLHTAILKLAAIFVFPGAVAVFIPSVPLAYLVSMVLYLSLLAWLLDLEGWDIIICAVVIAIVRAIGLVALGVLAGAIA